MKRNNELNRRSFSNFGFSTILIAFVMICIVTFSTLSLLTANSDYKLSQKVADRTHRYYQAEKEATVRLEQIDNTLSDAYGKSSNQATYYALARKYLKKLQPAISLADTSASTIEVCYSIEIDSTQTLDVRLSVTYPPNNGGTFYTLKTWQTTTTLPESTQDSLNLLGNE